MAIDWEGIIPEYNRRYKTDFKTVKAMLKHCYNNNGRNIHNVADVIGCSGNTICNKMRSLGLPRQNIFGNSSRTPTAVMLIEKPDLFEKHSVREIAKLLGRSRYSVFYAMRQLGITPPTSGGGEG